MAVQRGISSIIFSIIGIVIIVLAVFVIIRIFNSSPPAKELIYKTIELHKASEPVDRANLISSMDELVAESKSEEIQEQWDRMMGCLTARCPDEAFLDMVLVTVAQYEKDIPESALLINVIATSKYWSKPDHLLEFSKALSMSNEQIRNLDNRKIEKIWEQIVSCKGVCPEKNDLYFDLIKAVVQ